MNHVLHVVVEHLTFIISISTGRTTLRRAFLRQRLGCISSALPGGAVSGCCSLVPRSLPLMIFGFHLLVQGNFPFPKSRKPPMFLALHSWCRVPTVKLHSPWREQFLEPSVPNSESLHVSSTEVSCNTLAHALSEYLFLHSSFHHEGLLLFSLNMPTMLFPKLFFYHALVVRLFLELVGGQRISQGVKWL